MTIANRLYRLVIDTGSSDTWVASSTFQCDNQKTAYLASRNCGFGPLYNPRNSTTYAPVNYPFTVNYTGGEFLLGSMGTDVLGIGGVARGGPPQINVRQTIGIVNEGAWIGDGISSGLIGLAFPALAKGVSTRDLNYTSVIYTM